MPILTGEINNDDDDKLIQDALEDYGSTPYSIIERSGVRVGVYGVVGEDAQVTPESDLVLKYMWSVQRSCEKTGKEECGYDRLSVSQ
ncbi:MAG: hypothetical protein V8S08_09970 [Lachnoclostridium sp.]